MGGAEACLSENGFDRTRGWLARASDGCALEWETYP
jgi:hypothetical protein